MPGGIEAAGDVIAGGLIARAIEPGAGENVVDTEAKCLNCGTLVAGRYCQNCGQSLHVHRTLAAFWHDLLHAVFHFDGKFFRTIPLLAWKPGELTRRYVRGERVKFISPLALFLFSFVLMFAAFNWMGSPFLSQEKAPGSIATQANKEIGADLAKDHEKLAKLKAERAAAIATGANVKALDAKIARVEENIVGLETSAKLTSGMSVQDMLASNDASGVNINTGDKSLDAKIKHTLANPQLLLYKLQSSAYKFSWALIPLSVPFLWLMFAWRREFKIYDHAVFVTYSLSFMSLLLIALSAMNALNVPGDIPETLLVAIPPIHMFRQLKAAYGLSAFGALLRTSMLLVAASIVLVFFVLILLALGVMG
jgi:hypothetical protein